MTISNSQNKCSTVAWQRDNRQRCSIAAGTTDEEQRDNRHWCSIAAGTTDEDNVHNYEGRPGTKYVFVPMGLADFNISPLFRKEEDSFEFQTSNPNMAVFFDAIGLLDGPNPTQFVYKYPNSVFAGIYGDWRMEYTGTISPIYNSTVFRLSHSNIYFHMHF